MAKYKFEDIRGFYMRRHWLRYEPGEPEDYFRLTYSEYERLKHRELVLSPQRAVRIRAFIDGWHARA